MRVIEAGHIYALQSLDGGDVEILRFVKREGEGYPGNIGTHPGTIIQEVLRACLDRLRYVENQIHSDYNAFATAKLEDAIFYLEKRAAGRHGRRLHTGPARIDSLPTCKGCGHIECPGCER